MMLVSDVLILFRWGRVCWEGLEWLRRAVKGGVGDVYLRRDVFLYE